MASYSVELTRTAEKQLRKIAKRDRNRVVDAIGGLPDAKVFASANQKRAVVARIEIVRMVLGEIIRRQHEQKHIAVVVLLSVRLVHQPVAKKLGVSVETLYRWRAVSISANVLVNF